MPLEESFLFLVGKGHHEQLPRVAQAHQEQLHRDALARDESYCFTPIYLPVSPGIELQRNVHLRSLLLPASLSDVAPHGRLCPGVSLSLDVLVDQMPYVPLLAWQPFVLRQDLIDSRLVRP